MFNLALTSDFPSTPNEAVAARLRTTASSPRVAWIAPQSSLAAFIHTARFRQPQHFATGQRMQPANSRVTIHMVASLDGFIARSDGSTDWLETSDQFASGEDMDPAFVEAFLKTIDCYVMGSRTYETALGFEAKGLGWVYGNKPTFVLTGRTLPRTRDSVELYSGDL